MGMLFVLTNSRMMGMLLVLMGFWGWLGCVLFTVFGALSPVPLKVVQEGSAGGLRLVWGSTFGGGSVSGGNRARAGHMGVVLQT